MDSHRNSDDKGNIFLSRLAELRKCFAFSFKRMAIAVISFVFLFIIIVNVFNLSLNGEENLHTNEAVSTGEVVGYISDNNTVKQSLFFHKPVVLHSMDVLASNYGNTAMMPEMQFYVMDINKQNIYQGTIPTSSIMDNEWFHLDLGDIKLKANQRYFICFGGAVENADIVCPTFHMMESDYISDYLYINGQKISDRAICATYSYDILPMGKNSIVFFVLLFACVILMAAFKRGIISNNFVKLPQIMWLIFWGMFFFTAVFAAHPSHAWQISSYIVKEMVICIFLILLSVILYRVNIIRENLKKAGKYIYKYRLVFGIIFFTALLSVQFIIVNNIFQKNGFDVTIVWDIVSQILDTGQPVSSGYLNNYPNNIGISIVYLLLRSFVKGKDMAGQYYFVVVLNVLLVDIGVFMTYKTAKQLFGFFPAVISALWCALLIGFSGWIVVPYTDTMTFWIPVTILYLYLLMSDRDLGKHKRFVSASIIGFLAVWGYSLKPQCVIILIAIVIVVLCSHAWKKIVSMKEGNGKKFTVFVSQEEFLSFAMLIAVGVLAGFLTYNIGRPKVVSSEFTTANSMPMSHFIMMGLNENPNDIGIGGFSYEDTGISTQGNTTSDKKKINKEVIVSRLKDFGFSGFMSHLYNKGNWIIGDGTFFWLGEGSFLLEDYSKNDSEMQKKVREKYYNTVQEGNEDTAPYIKHMQQMSAIWFLTLFFIIFAPLLTSKEKYEKIWIPALAILGCLLFTMLFEGRSRYLINYLPLFAIVAVASVRGIFRRLSGIWKI